MQQASTNINQLEDLETAQATTYEIYALLGRLSEIYKSSFAKMLPTEVLQSQHSSQLFVKVMLEQHIDPNIVMSLKTSFACELASVIGAFTMTAASFNHQQMLDLVHNEDKQFSHPLWQENPYFILLKDLYHLIKKYSLKWIEAIQGLDIKTKEQLHFYLNNHLSLIAPTNNAWINPEVMESIITSKGQNLIIGFKNYLEDLVANNGQLNVRMTDLKAFSIGKNIGITPGKVIFQNDLIQLIQYTASTPKVNTIPILITPPYINKYYVLDLSPNNSLVKYLVDQGFTVYMISWVNPDASFAEKKFEDYVKLGPLQALDVVTKTSGSPSVHMVGYCIGGTILACALAYLKHKKDNRVKSATFLMSLVNFKYPGELGAFLDEPQLDALDKLMDSYGYLNGHLLDMTFNLLRPNDLIWPYYINHYLLGKPTKPFDILYWNADSTNLPYKMYSFYLRNMYLHNNLAKPGGITLDGVPIDLSKVTVPTFFLAAQTDHITLWRGIYSGLHLFSGPVDFVLTESGHVRGVLNPPSKDNKYGHRINPDFKTGADFHKRRKEWANAAARREGSWWPHWVEWLQKHDQTQVEARVISKNSEIEDAPGSYVLKRI